MVLRFVTYVAISVHRNFCSISEAIPAGNFHSWGFGVEIFIPVAPGMHRVFVHQNQA